MHYCLDKNEYEYLLMLRVKPEVINKDNYSQLNEIIISSENWDLELSCLSYFLAQIIDVIKSNNKNLSKKIIETAYELRNGMFMNIQEFDIKFIELMYSYIRDEDTDLQNELINLLDNFMDYSYGPVVRD